MDALILKTILMLLLPAIAFVGGVRFLRQVRGRQQVSQKPLNQRFGYDLGEVQDYWSAFDDSGRRAERRLLKLDLAFPFLYGGALAASLLAAWSLLGRRYPLAWILAPLAITLLADWTENFVHLEQLKRYMDHGQSALQESRIRIASTATALKLSFLGLSWTVLICLIYLLWDS